MKDYCGFRKYSFIYLSRIFNRFMWNVTILLFRTLLCYICIFSHFVCWACGFTLYPLKFYCQTGGSWLFVFSELIPLCLVCTASRQPAATDELVQSAELLQNRLFWWIISARHQRWIQLTLLSLFSQEAWACRRSGNGPGSYLPSVALHLSSLRETWNTMHNMSI